MSLLADDPVTQIAFSIYENKGVFALLLGSGLSRAAEIPTGWEITLDLIRRVARAQGVEEQPDWARWYRQETGEEPNYSKLLAELTSSPDERRSILHSYIEPPKRTGLKGARFRRRRIMRSPRSWAADTYGSLSPLTSIASWRTRCASAGSSPP
jgi:hypothetical protein